MRKPVVPLFVPALLGLALVACKPADQTPASAAPAKPAAPAQVAREAAMYQELLRSEAYELAGPIGRELINRFPDTPEAAQVRETIDDTERKAREIADKRRLERLWLYQTSTESGGAQNTATIYSNDPAIDGERVRLILRRHSAWGLSVYLFGSGKGFECAGECNLGATWDDQPPTKLKAYLPETGEPAIFIKDEKGFIARMDKARRLSLDVVVKGKGKKKLVFDVGGYDAAKFPPLAKKK